MNIDDYFFNTKKFNFALRNFTFWLKRCLELDERWVDVFNMNEWMPSKSDPQLLNAIEQQLANARAHLEREKQQLIVWIKQAPHGRKR